MKDRSTRYSSSLLRKKAQTCRERSRTEPASRTCLGWLMVHLPSAGAAPSPTATGRTPGILPKVRRKGQKEVRVGARSSPLPGTPGRGVRGEGRVSLRRNAPLTPDPSPLSTGERGGSALTLSRNDFTPTIPTANRMSIGEPAIQVVT